MKALFSKGVRKKETFTRPLVVPVRVQCGSRQCLAYRDQAGNWIDYENGEAICEKVKILKPSFH